MDVAAITQLISTVGFPIAVCAYLLYHQDKEEQQHREEMDKLSEALNNNTLALSKLTERMNTHE